MKRSIVALLLAGFAAVALAQPGSDQRDASVWAHDHNFIAPPQ